MWIKCWYLLNKKESFWFVSFSMFDISNWVLWPCVRDTCFSKCTGSLDRQVTWKSGWGPFTLTHNPTNLNCHWCCETGDAPFCDYKVITIYMSHVTRWLRSTQLMSHLAKIGGHCLRKVGDKAFFGISPDHMIIESCDSMGESHTPS